MEGGSLLQAGGSLALVIGGILGMAWLSQKFMLRTLTGQKGPVRQPMQIIARLPGRRSIVEVHCNDRRYHILLAADHSLLLDKSELEYDPSAAMHDEWQNSASAPSRPATPVWMQRAIDRLFPAARNSPSSSKPSGPDHG